jgi:Flp pilus assembly protein TadG
MKKKSLRRRRFSKQRRGTAVAEFAVCLPIIALFVFATIEACLMIYLKQTCTIAAYEGSRTALLPGALASDVTADVNQILADRNVQGGGVVVTPINIETLAVGNYMKVEITAPCEQNTLLGTWFYAGRNVSGAAEVMKEF